MVSPFFYTNTMKQLLYSLLLLPLLLDPVDGQCQKVKQVWVEDNQLVIVFDKAVEVNRSEGFRLIGGAARIKSMSADQQPTQITFILTDHVLPDDQFTLLYWPELGDIRIGSEKLQTSLNVAVTNRADQYQGRGMLYYVSTSGNDAFVGTDPSHPLRTVRQAQKMAQAGDYILLKRGDTFRNTFVDIEKSGLPDRYLTFAAYGQGEQPIVEHDLEDVVTVTDQEYVLIDNWHVKVKGNGETGIYLAGNCRYPVISNCRVEGSGKPQYGINYGKNDGPQEKVVYPQILNNHVTGCLWNIISTGYPYDGTHEVMGGLVENNVSAKNRSLKNGDGIDAQRGKFHGLVIRKNEIYDYFDDGIDLFSADSVIVEYNTIHTPQQPSSSGQGIKAGGLTNADKINGYQSTNIIIRHNVVYDIYNKVSDAGSHNGIQTNEGASGEIYGNLVYDVQGSGIVVSGAIKHWEVHHNIVVNAQEAGLNIWTEGSKDNQIEVYNNILEGEQADIKVNTRTTQQKVTGRNNVLVHGKAAGAYQGQDDQPADLATLFVNPTKHDFRLKPFYKQYLGTDRVENQKRE